MTDTIVLVTPTTSYRLDDFQAAAARAGVEVLVASDRCHVLDELYEFPVGSLVIDFYEPEAAAAAIVAAARERRVRAVVPTGGESAALVAALASRELGLPHSSVEATRAAADKHRMRTLCAEAGVPTPRFALVPVDTVIAPEGVGFPCVLKPRILSASRGVIRADDPSGYAAAHRRVAALLAQPAVREMDPDAAGTILVESFVPGAEVALEGLMTEGALTTLAVFDKPDPLDGPYFEETIYVTPSRHGDRVRAVEQATAAAARAIGLHHGPVHAELRLAPDGPVVIEIAARSIGGLCARILRFGTGLTLEDLIVRHAMGEPIAATRERRAAGVMMIPIPAAGVLKKVRGIEAALAVPSVEEVTITARLEQEIVPLPDGAAYLGFIFAHGEGAAAVEDGLRAAHRKLEIVIQPMLPVV